MVFLRKEQAVADQNRAEEEVVEEVVHVKAPLDKAGVTGPADSSIQQVGDVLKKDRYRCAPEPLHIIACEKAE